MKSCTLLAYKGPARNTVTNRFRVCAGMLGASSSQLAPHAPTPPVEVNSQLLLHQLAQAGANIAQLQQAAMQMQLQALQPAGAVAGMAEGAAASHPHVLGAHRADPPTETLEQSKGRLEEGSLKRAMFLVHCP